MEGERHAPAEEHVQRHVGQLTQLRGRQARVLLERQDERREHRRHGEALHGGADLEVEVDDAERRRKLELARRLGHVEGLGVRGHALLEPRCTQEQCGCAVARRCGSTLVWSHSARPTEAETEALGAHPRRRTSKGKQPQSLNKGAQRAPQRLNRGARGELRSKPASGSLGQSRAGQNRGARGRARSKSVLGSFGQKRCEQMSTEARCSCACSSPGAFCRPCTCRRLFCMSLSMTSQWCSSLSTNRSLSSSSVRVSKSVSKSGFFISRLPSIRLHVALQLPSSCTVTYSSLSHALCTEHAHAHRATGLCRQPPHAV